MSALALLTNHRPKRSSASGDLETLLGRMRRRRYPESLSVLASYWLKAVWRQGHNRAWWRELDRRLQQVLGEQRLETASREILTQVKDWIRQTVFREGKTAAILPPLSEPFRTNLTPQRLQQYAVRLLNDWMPAEVSRLLVEEVESGSSEESGIRDRIVARALERLLVRERLLPGALEMLLQPDLLSPQYVYPADLEILRDVVLALLRRTAAQEPGVLPAVLAGSAAEALDTAEYKEAITRACYVLAQGEEEIHVPISRALAFEILAREPLKIGSILVTMDGRWWESEKLQSDGEHVVVYRPGGRLRIDYSADHAKLKMPWPESQLRWSGAVRLPASFEIFGREWHAARWETDANGTWLTLEFSRTLSMREARDDSATPARRSRPASVDMAWAALERALAAAFVQNSDEPVENLHHSDLIPLARALYRLTNAMKSRHWNRETVETQLRAIRYLEAGISPEYGRIPFKILPAVIRDRFRKIRADAALAELFDQVFDAISPPRAA